jgi:hypothetical protein
LNDKKIDNQHFYNLLEEVHEQELVPDIVEEQELVLDMVEEQE